MPTPVSSSAILAQDTYPHMQAWVGELCGQLIACGLTQTNDSGQLTLAGSGPTAVASWGSAAIPTGTGVANAVANILFTFNDPLALSGLSTTALRSGGTGYTNGTATAMVVTGVTSGATSARASCTVAGGIAGNLTITTAGTGYIVGEQLTVAGIGAGTGANWTATALTGGAPVIFRLDFGGGGSTTSPQVWITVGAGTNGAGTIAGVAGTSRMTQVAAFTGNLPSSLITAYTSRFNYNATLGYLGLCFKLGSIGVSGIGSQLPTGSIILCRTSDSSGSPTSNAVALITNSTTTAGIQTAASGCMQCMTWTSGAGSTIYPTINSTNSGLWLSFAGNFVFGLAATLENSIAFVPPIYTMDPGLKFNAFNGVALLGDFPQGNTASFAMVGATPLTFISLGSAFGNTGTGGFGGTTNANLTFCMLWQ